MALIAFASLGVSLLIVAGEVMAARNASEFWLVLATAVS
jgi:hypothetical protein